MSRFCFSIMLFITCGLYAQESTELQTSFVDKKTGVAYTASSSEEGIIHQLEVIKNDSKKIHKLPKTIDKIKWVQLTDGVWIDKKSVRKSIKTDFDPNTKFVCHYSGHLENAKKFDSSFDRKKVLSGELGRLIKGFSIGIENIEVGDFAVIKIAPEMGYGSANKGVIPPDSTLLFYIYKIQ